MIWRILTLAALLGAVLSACGDSSASDPRSGSAGDGDVGVSDDSGRDSPCPSGQVQKKADGRTVCTVQPNVEGDGTIGDAEGAGGSIDPTSDAGSDAEPTTPDAAGDECPDLEGRSCPNRNNCTIHAVEGSYCSFNCVNADGSPNFGATEGIEGSRRLLDFCGMTL